MIPLAATCTLDDVAAEQWRTQPKKQGGGGLICPSFLLLPLLSLLPPLYFLLTLLHPWLKNMGGSEGDPLASHK